MSTQKTEGFWNTQSSAQEAAVREGLRGGTIESHPAFGQISLVHVSGHSALYGSDFPHQHCVAIEIARSELHRDLSYDRPSQQEPLIRIEMSFAQFGSFVASQGRGEGTQCTIRRLQVGDDYVGMPNIKLRDEGKLFEKEGRENVDIALKQIDDLIADVSGDLSGLSKTKREAVLDRLRKARQEIGPNLKFVADQFAEHLEERSEKQKTEVMAWIDNHIRRAGLEAIAAGAPAAQQIEHTTGGDE